MAITGVAQINSYFMKTIPGIYLALVLFSLPGCTGDDIVAPTPERAPCVTMLTRNWKMQGQTVNGQPVQLSNAYLMVTKRYSQTPAQGNEGTVLYTDLAGSWKVSSNCNSLTETYQSTGNPVTTFQRVLMIVSLTATQLTVGYVSSNGDRFEDTYAIF
jgi:hypothetical protein